MATKISQSLEDQVTCPICLEQYQDPRILPCLHTYCRKCLEDLLDKSSRRFSIQCPECRETFQIENITSLRVNIWINKNITLLKQTENDQKDEAAPMCYNDTCDSKGQAEVKCCDCEVFMCTNCIKAHQAESKVTKEHHLMALEDIKKKDIPSIEQSTLCGTHKGRKQKLFCKKCETLICRDCTLFDHKDHDFVFIAGALEEQKGKLQKEMKGLCTGKKKEVESALKAVKDMQERVRKNEETVKKEIDEKINDKIAILEEMRAKLKQESTDLAAAKMKRLSLQQDGLEMHLAGLTSAVEFTENILAKGSDHDVLSMKKQVESRLSELSNKEVDNEVEEDDKQTVQVKEIPQSSFENYLVITDSSTPDPKMCSVAWIPFTPNLGIYIRNYLNQPIDINTKRIVIKCSGRSPFACSKSGTNGVFIIDGSFRHPVNVIFGAGELVNLEVLIDGSVVQGGPLKVLSV